MQTNEVETHFGLDAAHDQPLCREPGPVVRDPKRVTCATCIEILCTTEHATELSAN